MAAVTQVRIIINDKYKYIKYKTQFFKEKAVMIFFSIREFQFKMGNLRKKTFKCFSAWSVVYSVSDS